MIEPYTPTDAEIIRYFDAPHYKVDPQGPDEDFAAYLGRISVETMHHRIQSEAAARRWLTAHDAALIESLAEEMDRTPNPVVISVAGDGVGDPEGWTPTTTHGWSSWLRARAREIRGEEE